MSKLFHMHEWETIDVKYNPSNFSEGSGIPYDMADKLLFGVTNITIKCKICGKINIIQQTGKTNLSTDKKEEDLA